jgi:ethanolamine utilization protein EutN
LTLGKIIKELTCSVKDPKLNPSKLLLVKALNPDLSEREEQFVALETRLGLGKGDIVLMVSGSGARKVEGHMDLPIDCAITAKVENINIESGYKSLL